MYVFVFVFHEAEKRRISIYTSQILIYEGLLQYVFILSASIALNNFLSGIKYVVYLCVQLNG
jgi:hypothetical protein